MHGPGWWHFGGMWFWWIVIVVAVVALLWVVFSSARQRGAGRETAEDVLKKRYANGEIDEETYERKLKELRA